MADDKKNPYSEVKIQENRGFDDFMAGLVQDAEKRLDGRPPNEASLPISSAQPKEITSMERAFRDEKNRDNEKYNRGEPAKSYLPPKDLKRMRETDTHRNNLRVLLETYQDGQQVENEEPKDLVPQVEVETPAPAEGEQREIEKVDAEIADVVEAVPAVVAEEKAKAAEIQEPAIDTAPAGAAKSHDEFAKPGQPDADAGQADKLEKVIGFNPDSEEME